MKKVVNILAGALIIITACSNNAPEPKYAPESNEYKFFKVLSEKIPVLNPDQSNELISAKGFSIYTSDIMPGLYQMWGRHGAEVQKLPENQLASYVLQVASQEAEKRLFLEAADENNISITPDTVQAEMEKYYASAGGEEAFSKHIMSQGLTLDFVRTDISNRMKIQKFLTDVVYQDIGTIEETEIKDAYNQEKYVTVRHILMSTQHKTDAEKDDIRKKMEMVLEKARAGEDFGELAKQYSEDPGSKDKGGLYENLPRGRTVKEFEEASFNLPVGSISDLVETQFGYHIIKVINRTKETRPLDQVEDELRNELLRTKKQQAYQSTLKSLKTEFKYKEIFTA